MYKIHTDHNQTKGKSVETKFEKSSVIRQPNAFKSQRPSILGKPTTFSNSFVRKDFSKSTSVTQTHVSNDFSKPVTAQILPLNKKSILKNTNVLNPGMYKIHTDHTQTRTSKLPPDSRKTNKHVTFSTGVIPSTSVRRPLLKSNPMEDRVLRNNSRGKKQEVEDHRRNVKLPKNKTSVTACNDSLNDKTLNVKSVSMCDKCVLIDKHDMCVRKSVAKPLKETVASESNKKPRNFTRKIYEHLVEIVLFIIDPGCSKHMTGNLKLLINFVEKFLGTLKFIKDHLCSSCELGKAKRKSFHTKLTPSSKRRLQLLHMDLCGPMRVASINGKRYVLVIIADYSRYTWTHFLRSKDKTPEVLIDFLRLVQRGLQAQVGVVMNVSSWGYSTQSIAYRVFNKRTRVIMESIHVNFDELPQMASDQLSSDPAPECQTMTLNHDSLSPAIQCQANVPQADRTVIRSNELDLLFSPMFDELLNGSSKVVSKSSAVSAADAPNQRQQYTTPLNNHTTPAPTCQAPPFAPSVISS
nr:Gag-Pol polyprotein [Tanacetum cinerariifolium]